MIQEFRTMSGNGLGANDIRYSSKWYKILIGGIPIAMPIVLSVTMAIESHRLSQ